MFFKILEAIPKLVEMPRSFPYYIGGATPGIRYLKTIVILTQICES